MGVLQEALLIMEPPVNGNPLQVTTSHNYFSTLQIGVIGYYVIKLCPNAHIQPSASDSAYLETLSMVFKT